MTYHFLIIGQGLAGTLLAHFLQKEKQKVCLIDQAHQGAASRVAAGIINPITGRRYVKSWRIEELLPFAEKTYGELEKLLKVRIYQKKNVLRSLFNAREQNDWLARTGEPGYESFMLENPELGNYEGKTVPAFSYGEVTEAAQVDIDLLVQAYEKLFLANKCLRTERFDYEALQIGPDHVRYKDLKAGKVIFCEGHRAEQNPFFNYLPFSGAKGEVLIIRIPGGNFGKMLKHRIFIVPWKEDLYWVGASYSRKYEDDRPTTKGRKFLEERLDDLLKIPYEVVMHKAAIRPTVKDRRPFLGLHPQYPQLAIFNGLGAKGASLGPFWADKMKDFLLKKAKLDAAVDIRRFVH